MTAGIIIYIFIVGGAVYLIFENPIVFWLIVLPIAIVVFSKFVNWLKR